MTINLSDDLQAFIREKIASGQYASADEIIETALLELKNIETGELDARWLKAKIAVGQAALDAGDSMSAEECMRRLRERAAAIASKVHS